jgi:hypothetical protein
MIFTASLKAVARTKEVTDSPRREAALSMIDFCVGVERTSRRAVLGPSSAVMGKSGADEAILLPSSF